MLEQRLDFTAESVVARARLGEKIGPFVGGSRQRRVKEPFDLQPLVRCHFQPFRRALKGYQPSSPITPVRD